MPEMIKVAAGHYIDPSKVRSVAVRSAWRDTPDRMVVIIGGKHGASETMTVAYDSYEDAIEAADMVADHVGGI